MTRKRANERSMASELRVFLNQLSKWGICLYPADSERIAERKCITADEFAREVMEVEGLGWDSEWVRRLRKKFVERFGEELRVEDFEEGGRFGGWMGLSPLRGLREKSEEGFGRSGFRGLTPPAMRSFGPSGLCRAIAGWGGGWAMVTA